MEKTGQTFDMNAETFTLQNIFAMELHRFQDKIAEIVNCAIKELAIEKVSSLLFFSFLFSSLRGRQPLNCLALRPPIWPNALPLINQLVFEISWWLLQTSR